jgi:sugar O-acyltransferase (sialic acid O-acetyltransferase NeuD family)
MKNIRLIMVGAGALGREIINWVTDITKSGNLPKVSGFLDIRYDALSSYSYDLEYLGKIEEYNPTDNDRFILGIGDPSKKRRIIELLKSKNGKFITVIHPTAVIADSAFIGEGVVICPHSFISADAKIGDFVTVNGLSSIGHDVILGNFSTLSAHVDLTGWVRIGEECFFGTGAKVMPKVTIGQKSKVGAGTLIMRDVKPGSVMYTLPAKKL